MAFPSHLRTFGSWNYNGDIVICGGYFYNITDDERDDCFRFKAEEKYSVMHTFPKLLTTLTYFATCVIDGVLWLAGGVRERQTYLLQLHFPPLWPSRILKLSSSVGKESCQVPGQHKVPFIDWTQAQIRQL